MPRRPSPPPALPRLGILATGTGGDFGRSLGIAPAREAYLEALARGRERLVDVGRARFAPRRHDDSRTQRHLRMMPHKLRGARHPMHPGEQAAGASQRPSRPADVPQGSSLMVDRYFVNVLSAGIGGLVDRYAAAMPAAAGGRLAYGLAALAAVVTCRRRRLILTATLPDGSTSAAAFDGYALAIGNGHTFGGGMRVAPDASPFDGVLEVVTFETPTKPTMLRHFLSLYKGEHLTKPGVAHFAAIRLELRAAAGERPDAARPAAPPPGDLFPLDIDGDNLGDLPLTVEVVPRALRVLV